MLFKLSFTVRTGENPVPYKRTTQRQKFADAGYKRYQQYKQRIVAEFAKTAGRLPQQVLTVKTKYRVETKAYFKDLKHADMSNVHKGVEDSIFQKPLNDKYIVGSFDYEYDDEDPRLEITIKDT